MAILTFESTGNFRFSIATKLGVLLATFGVLASGLTGYYTFHATREILVKKASEYLVRSTQVIGRRFSILLEEIGRDAKLFARTPSTREIIGSGHAVEIARQRIAGQFTSLLAEHPEYYQARLISAQDHGLELVRVDRDGDSFKTVTGKDLQEKLQYPYVYQTLRLPAGQVHHSKIFINREIGAHSGLDKPTLQVATPVTDSDGKALGVMVINVDLNRIFSLLKANLRPEYQLYLTNQAGDYLIHPDSEMTFGFDFGRRFLVQNTFKPVADIIGNITETTSVLTASSDLASKVVGGFARIPFGEQTSGNFVIIGMTVPLDIVLAETGTLKNNTNRIVIGFSLLAIVLSILVALFFVRPLKRLVKAVQHFSEMRESTPIHMRRNDELGLLANSISEMQEHVLSYLNDLNTQNQALHNEVRERNRMERYDKFRSHTLELIAGNVALPDILEAIVRGVEQLNPTMLCSILLLDSEGKHLVKGLAPSLPDFYNTAIDGIEIGMGVGSCGTAAFTGKRVIVEDLQTHPYWTLYKELTTKANLGSCWSQPILSSTNKVLGTFAIYHREAYTPADSDIELIEQSARIASIAIEHKQTEDQVLQLALYDPLTSLPNRRTLTDRLHQALASSSRSGKAGALLFIDLDNFKTLNDTLGHDMGDLLLQQVAHRLLSCVREGDTVSRLGGDEFVVILEDLSNQSLEAAAQVEAIGEKILGALNQPYQLASHKQRSTPSIGATLFSEHKSSSDELLKQADIAMYQAKKSGRNAFRFFDPQMQDIISARALLEDELRHALIKQEFQLYYQIQMDSSKRPTGSEALIRWVHPVRGLVLPQQFITLAEETGLIIPIGQWVLETACSRLKAWQQNELTRNLILAVNVSAKQFRHIDFITQVQAAVNLHGIDAKLLKLELTESLLLDDIESTISTMSALNNIGVQFSLDDFGTGYSSLQYLKLLPFDQLKIDQSFVRDITTNSSDKTIVRTIIAMADSLELRTIAEGVETEEQLQFLIRSGCAQFQGYLFGKPGTIEQFEALLKQG